MSLTLTKKRAVTELVGAGAIWGFGFVATILSLKSFGPLTSIVLRFVLATLFFWPLLFIIPSFKSKKHWELLKYSFLPGIFLALLMFFQTWGMKYTTATKSGFITTLYIIFVPFVEGVFFRKRIKNLHYLFVFVALIGTALICEFHGGHWNIGDLLTLVCSWAATFHMIVIGRVAQKVDSSMAFNVYQSFWAIFIPLGFLFIMPEPMVSPLEITEEALFGMLWLIFLSTGLAFMLQIRAQRVLSPSIASILFLLESSFAAFFAFFVLGEMLTGYQWFGAILILASAYGVVKTEV